MLEEKTNLPWNSNRWSSQKNYTKILIFTSMVKRIMTKKPISIDKNELVAKALAMMNSKKITSLVHKKNHLENYWDNSYSYNFTI